MNMQTQRWQLNHVPHNLAGGFVFPGASLLQRPIERDCSWIRAVNNTTPAIPALIRMQNDWRISFVGIRNKYVDLAHIHTGVASFAVFRIENHRRIWRCNVWQSANFYLSHRSLPISLYKPQCNLCCGLRNWLSYRPNNSKAVRRI